MAWHHPKFQLLLSIQPNKSNFAICLMYGLDFKILLDELNKFFSAAMLVNLFAEKCHSPGK